MFERLGPVGLTVSVRRAQAALRSALVFAVLASAGASASAQDKPAADKAVAATPAVVSPAVPAAANAAANKGAPPGFTAPADPKPGESNAERSRSQPGSNTPMWSAVRESGTAPGTTTLPGAEKGVLIQEFVQYLGSAKTTAGEAWREEYQGRPALRPAVCLGQIMEHEKLHDGRFNQVMKVNGNPTALTTSALVTRCNIGSSPSA